MKHKSGFVDYWGLQCISWAWLRKKVESSWDSGKLGNCWENITTCFKELLMEYKKMCFRCWGAFAPCVLKLDCCPDCLLGIVYVLCFHVEVDCVYVFPSLKQGPVISNCSECSVKSLWPDTSRGVVLANCPRSYASGWPLAWEADHLCSNELSSGLCGFTYCVRTLICVLGEAYAGHLSPW